MGTSSIYHQFNYGDAVLVSPGALALFGYGWDIIYDLVEKTHLQGKFGKITQDQKILNETTINRAATGTLLKTNPPIISIHNVAGWDVLIITRIPGATSVMLEAEKSHWRL